MTLISKNIFFLMILALSVLVFISCRKQVNERKTDDNKNLISYEVSAYILKANIISADFFILADTIQYFTNQKAIDAYKEDFGKISDENTFYIRNIKKDSIKYSVAEDINIQLKTFSFNNHGSFKKDTLKDFSAFVELFNSLDSKYAKQIPFTFTVENNKITKIEEIYIP